jgi:hypothetical protein
LLRHDLLQDLVGLLGPVRAADRTVDHERHPAIHGFDIKFITLPAIALNFYFQHNFPGDPLPQVSHGSRTGLNR